MAETPFNGHAPDGPQIADAAPLQPMMPRIAAPEGARSARDFNGAPIEIEETTFDNALENSDFQESFARDSSHGGAPLGIVLEKNEPEFDDPTHGFGAYAPEKLSETDENDENDEPDPYRNHALEAAGIDAFDTIEGEQLFADDGAGGEPPIDDIALAASGGNGRPDTPKDQELGLFEHLAELRSRLLYAILGVMLVMCLTWNYSRQLQDWFSSPIRRVLNENGIKKGDLVLLGAPDAFTVFFQFSLASALLLAAPWVSFQVWRFIEPALTNSERRYTLILVPFSSVLFFMGAGLGYAVSPLFFKFFLQFQPVGVDAQWRYDESILLMAKMLLIFGLAFQVPIVVIFGHKIGLITRNVLIEYWRHAVIAIFILVAVLTPTWDPMTMTACALPPCLLYLLSIWLVKWL